MTRKFSLSAFFNMISNCGMLQVKTSSLVELAAYTWWEHFSEAQVL